MAKPKNFRTVRIFDKALKQSNELIRGLRKAGPKGELDQRCQHRDSIVAQHTD